MRPETVKIVDHLLNQSGRHWNEADARLWFITDLQAGSPVAQAIAVTLDNVELAELRALGRVSSQLTDSRLASYRVALDADKRPSPGFLTAARAVMEEEAATTPAGLPPRWAYDVLVRQVERFGPDSPEVAPNLKHDRARARNHGAAPSGHGALP